MHKSLIPMLFVLAIPFAVHAAEGEAVEPMSPMRCLDEAGTPCGARAEIEAAARCALSTMRVAAADDEEGSPDPSRVLADRKEALSLLAAGDEAEALVIARGLRAMFPASCPQG